MIIQCKATVESYKNGLNEVIQLMREWSYTSFVCPFRISVGVPGVSLKNG